MRLFAAVDPSAEAVTSLATVLPPDDRLRFVPQDQWHITLAFYGEVPESALEGLSERLGRAAARTPPLRLAFAAAGTFPASPHRARVLWCGLSGELDELARLAERAAEAGRRSGFDLEDRHFRPHLTLARCRREPADLSAAVRALSGFASPPWTVEVLKLMRSHLGAVARHEQLASWPLGGSELRWPGGSDRAAECRSEADCSEADPP